MCKIFRVNKKATRTTLGVVLMSLLIISKHISNFVLIVDFEHVVAGWAIHLHFIWFIHSDALTVKPNSKHMLCPSPWYHKRFSRNRGSHYEIIRKIVFLKVEQDIGCIYDGVNFIKVAAISKLVTFLKVNFITCIY